MKPTRTPHPTLVYIFATVVTAGVGLTCAADLTSDGSAHAAWLPGPEPLTAIKAYAPQQPAPVQRVATKWPSSGWSRWPGPRTSGRPTALFQQVNNAQFYITVV